MNGCMKVVLGIIVIFVGIAAIATVAGSIRVQGDDVADIGDSAVKESHSISDPMDLVTATDSGPSELTATELEYTAQMSDLLNNYGDVAEYFSDLNARVGEDVSLIIDDQWRIEVLVAMVSYNVNGETARNIDAPPRFQAVHDQVLIAVNHFDRAMELYAIGIDNIDSTYIEISSEEILAGNAALVSATELLDGITHKGSELDNLPDEDISIGEPDQSEPNPNSIGYSVNSASNLRAGPGIDFKVIGKRLVGDVIYPVATNASGDWYKLDNGAWIVSFLIDNPPTGLPVVGAES